MKTNNIVTRAFFISILVFVLGACLNPFDQDEHSTAGRHPVTVYLDGVGSSSIVPDVESYVAQYQVLLSRDGFDSVSVTETSAPFGFQAVEEGEWSVSVTAFNTESVAIGTGSSTLSVSAEEPNEVSVSVVPATTSTGAAEIVVTWPSGAIDALGSAELLAEGQETPVDVATDVTIDMDASQPNATYLDDNLDSGIYRFSLSFENAGTTVAYVTEMLYVYDGATSTASIDLSGGDIGQPPNPPSDGTASITGINEFEISWNGTSNIIEGYRVYAGTPDDAPEYETSGDVTTADSSTEELNWQGSLGDTQTYTVTAFNDFGESDPIAIEVTPVLFASGVDIATDAEGVEYVYATDLDGDGYKDILSVSPMNDEIVWYQNDGTGSFSSGTLISSSLLGPESVHTGDLDGDGDQDIVAAFSGAWGVWWFENDGSGNFSPQIKIADFSYAARVVVEDLDSDGDKDVLVGSSQEDGIVWYENTDGNGTFSSATPLTSGPVGVDALYAMDLDGDHDVDIVAAMNDGITWFENNEGSFTAGVEIATGISHFHMADIDRDGDTDIVAASSDTPVMMDPGVDWYWYENNGGGVFAATTMPTNLYTVSSIRTADVDGDGDIDVLAAEAETHGRIEWYENTDGNGTFASPTDLTPDVTGARSMLVTDLDGDQDADVLSAFAAEGRIMWYEGFSGIDTTAPEPVTRAAYNVYQTPGEATIIWNNPSDADLDAIHISWATADSPETEVGSTIISGAAPGERYESFVIPGVMSGTEHIATLTAVDAAGGTNGPNRSRPVYVRLKPKTINRSELSGVSVPDTGEIPQTSITETDQFTGIVSWDPADDPFLGETVYTATITLTAKNGYTLTGIPANYFAVAGADSVTNDGDSGVISAVFPETTYDIGDTGPAGGIVFFIDTAGDHSWTYLEVAPESTEWTSKRWSVAGTYVGGDAELTGIGDGQAATQAIVDRAAADGNWGTDYAAHLCDSLSYDYGGTTFDDWFLPSKDELNAIWVNIVDDGSGSNSGTGGFSTSTYWSSSENPALNNLPWFQSFDDGTQVDGSNKFYEKNVRAIRSF